MDSKLDISIKSETLSDCLNETILNSEMSDRSVNYQCSICEKLFVLHDEATEHLNTFHRDRLSVNPQSLKTVPVKECRRCNKMVKSLVMHVCDLEEAFHKTNKRYCCLACPNSYSNIRAFDNHTMKMHGDMIESLYFTNVHEFLDWKDTMESESYTNYSLVEIYDDTKYYHCKYKHGLMDQKVIDFCPSMIVVSEFPRGVQVKHYKKHQDHGFLEYTLDARFRKSVITVFMRPRDDDRRSMIDDGDQYLQLKMLLDNIIVEAAKIDRCGLKKIMGKALEMASILNNYDEEIDDNTDQNIDDSTDAKRPDVLNRCHSEEDHEPSVKKAKIMSPMIVSSFSLADNVDGNNLEGVKCDIDEEIEKSNLSRRAKSENNIANDEQLKTTGDSMKNSYTFNDTYKEFVTKTFAVKDKKFKRQKNTSNNNNEFNLNTIPKGKHAYNELINGLKRDLNEIKITKVKRSNSSDDLIDDNIINNIKTEEDAPDEMQFAPKSSYSNITNEFILNNENMTESNVKTNINEDSQIKKEQIIKKEKIDKQTILSSKFNLKNLMSQSKNKLMKVAKKKVKKQIMKTKIGQFKPMKSAARKVVFKPNEAKVTPSSKKVDLDYEVIEQEADCNILVLKL